MPTYYAATNLTDRSASTGARARRVLAFPTRAERDQFVNNYPTNDCAVVLRSELSDAEAEAAQIRAGV